MPAIIMTPQRLNRKSQIKEERIKLEEKHVTLCFLNNNVMKISVTLSFIHQGSISITRFFPCLRPADKQLVHL